MWEDKTKSVTLDMQSLAFQPVLPWENHPKAVEFRDGKCYVRIRADASRSVQGVIEDGTRDFQKTDDGIWELEFPYHDGIKYIQLLFDGQELLSPLLPIVYGYSRPYNIVEQPVPGEEFHALKDVPHGSLRREYFHSAVTGEWESCVVYTPPSYDREPGRVYPVLYLQHGHGENETGWSTAGRVNFILDNLIAEGRAAEFAVVMCNGMVQKARPDGSRFVDPMLFEDYLLQDAIPFAESRLRIGGEKRRRAVAGLSMGSMQASILACNHPEMFDAVGIFSGFLHDIVRGSELDMLDRPAGDNAHLRALDDAAEFNSRFRVFFRAIGDRDPYLPFFREDDALCTEKGIRQTRKIYEGVHDWNVWRRCLYDFAQMIFKEHE